jgi:hypothetical protein
MFSDFLDGFLIFHGRLLLIIVSSLCRVVKRHSTNQDSRPSERNLLLIFQMTSGNFMGSIDRFADGLLHLEAKIEDDQVDFSLEQERNFEFLAIAGAQNFWRELLNHETVPRASVILRKSHNKAELKSYR